MSISLLTYLLRPTCFPSASPLNSCS